MSREPLDWVKEEEEEKTPGFSWGGCRPQSSFALRRWRDSTLQEKIRDSGKEALDK